MKTTGFGELQKKLEQIQRKTKALSGKHDVSTAELFSPDFMRRNTTASSFASFMEAGGYHVNSLEELEAIPKNKLDAYVRSNSKFSSWQDMLQSASQAYFAKKLGL